MSQPVSIVTTSPALQTVVTDIRDSDMSQPVSIVTTSPALQTVVTDIRDSDMSQPVSIVTTSPAVQTVVTDIKDTFAVPEISISDLETDKSTQLGTGTFGTVHKGTWVGSTVAVKIIPVVARSRNKMMKSIEKEICINTKLRHPNIIQFLAYSKGEKAVYLVHEFIDGSNMEDVIFDKAKKQELGIRPHNKLFIAQQVMQGVAYMHALCPAIVHQDIKPGNIIIQKSTFVAKLCDFGISRIKSVLASTTTTLGSVDGSPGYMAPECLVGGDKSTTASDVWSVGVTLLEFFCERDAWDVDGEINPVEKIREMMQKEILPIRESDIMEPEVRIWLANCLNFNPCGRSSAVDILSQIRLFRTC